MGRKGLSAEISKYTISKKERYVFYYNRLKSIALSRFEYKNMPPEIDVRFLELTFFEKGFAVWFKEDIVEQYAALTAMYGGNFDKYNEPLLRTAYANNGYQVQLNETNSILLWNNMLRENDVSAIQYFAKRLANAETVIDVNMNAQKTPIIIATPEEEKLSIKNTMNEYDDGSYTIYGLKNLNLDYIKTLNIGAPFIADKAMDIKDRIWNEALTYLGIPNVTVTKKERLIVDEVQRMQGGVLASSAGHLEMRRQCFDKVNKMYGLNIEVNMRYLNGGTSEENEEMVVEDIE